jgi:ERCC4-type nuclease
MKVITDIHERESGIPAALANLGMRIEERQLSTGDYVIEGLAVIERKTVADLHQSVQRGRFWAQIGKLRHAGKWPYLLIEGPSLYRRSLRDEAVRGLVICRLGSRSDGVSK